MMLETKKDGLSIALEKIINKYNTQITEIYICETNMVLDGKKDFIMIEFYINFEDEVITNELQKEVNMLFSIDYDSDYVFIAYIYEGTLPENTKITKWKKGEK